MILLKLSVIWFAIMANCLDPVSGNPIQPQTRGDKVDETDDCDEEGDKADESDDCDEETSGEKGSVTSVGEKGAEADELDDCDEEDTEADESDDCDEEDTEADESDDCDEEDTEADESDDCDEEDSEADESDLDDCDEETSDEDESGTPDSEEFITLLFTPDEEEPENEEDKDKPVTILIQKEAEKKEKATAKLITKDTELQFFESSNPVNGEVQLQAVKNSILTPLREERNNLKALVTEQMKTYSKDGNSIINEEEFNQLKETEQKLMLTNFDDIDGNIDEQKLISLYEDIIDEQMENLKTQFDATANRLYPDSPDPKLDRTGFNKFMSSLFTDLAKSGQSATSKILKKSVASQIFKSYADEEGHVSVQTVLDKTLKLWRNKEKELKELASAHFDIYDENKDRLLDEEEFNKLKGNEETPLTRSDVFKDIVTRGRSFGKALLQQYYSTEVRQQIKDILNKFKQAKASISGELSEKEFQQLIQSAQATLLSTSLNFEKLQKLGNVAYGDAVGKLLAINLKASDDAYFRGPAAELIKKYDKIKEDGKLDEEEFNTIKEPAFQEELEWRSFEEIDTDKEGDISKVELVTLLSEYHASVGTIGFATKVYNLAKEQFPKAFTDGFNEAEFEKFKSAVLKLESSQ